MERTLCVLNDGDWSYCLTNARLRLLKSQARFLNLDQTVWSNRETREPFTSTVRLRWRTVPCKKSMDLSGPRSDRPVLWTITGSYGSNGCLCFSLKTASFHFFFFPPIRRRLEHTFNNLKNHSRPLPHSETLSQSLFVSSSLSQSLSRLCLSPSSPSQLTLYLVTVAVVWYFITSNLLFLC